jgi:hypothetical protein
MTVSILQDVISGSRDGTPTAFDPTKSTVILQAVMSEETARDASLGFNLLLLAQYSENGNWVTERKAVWHGPAPDDTLNNPGHPLFPKITATFPTSKPLYVNSRIEVIEGVSMSVGTSITIS